MKEVIAVVRMNMMNRTKQALTEAGIAAFFAHEALGRGKGLVNPLVLQGAAQGREEAVTVLGEKDKLYPKRMVTVVVPDRKLWGTLLISIIFYPAQTARNGRCRHPQQSPRLGQAQAQFIYKFPREIPPQPAHVAAPATGS